MIDFSLTENQKMLRKWAHDFAEKEMRPVSLEMDHQADPDKCYEISQTVVKKALKLGLGKVMIPSEFGGLGGTLLDQVLVLEELAWGDVAMAAILNLMSMIPFTILMSGNKAQFKWIKMTGEDDTGTVQFCGSMTEPAGGSEMLCPLPDPKLGMQGTAVLHGNEYVLNASRVFCSNRKASKAFVITLRTDTKKPNWESLADFIVPIDAPGVHIGRTADLVGLRGLGQGELYLDNVRVPKDSLLAPANLDFHAYLGSGPITGIMSLGVARAAYEEALKYASERKIWGQPIREHELIADKLATMAIQVETARLMCWKVAWSLSNPPEVSDGFMRFLPMAKIYPTSLVRSITTEAVQIMGAYGLSRDTLVEKWARDAMIFPIIDCPNEIQKIFLAKRL